MKERRGRHEKTRHYRYRLKRKHSAVEGSCKKIVMAAEMEKKLQKNKQITVLKMRVGGMQWIYLGVLFCTSYIAQEMQKHITGIFRNFFNCGKGRS